jgi:hypothetical protein
VRLAWSKHTVSIQQRGLSALLIGLVVTSSFSSQIGWISGMRGSAPVGRQFGLLPTEDVDPIEDPLPQEGDAFEGAEAQFVQKTELRLFRSTSHRAFAFLLPRNTANSSARVRASEEWVTSSHPASGRALRQWIQSHIC